jgi:plasmid stabilization system protein ParE
MRVRYTDTARDEIDDIISEIVRDNPTVAADIATALQHTVRRIVENPEAAPVVYKTTCTPN